MRDVEWAMRTDREVMGDEGEREERGSGDEGEEGGKKMTMKPFSCLASSVLR